MIYHCCKCVLKKCKTALQLSSGQTPVVPTTIAVTLQTEQIPLVEIKAAMVRAVGGLPIVAEITARSVRQEETNSSGRGCVGHPGDVLINASLILPQPTPPPTPDPTPDPTPNPTPNPTPDPTPDPTPNPTPYPLPCNGVTINQFAGETVSVSQTSTLYGRNTYTYVIEIGGQINQKTSDAGNYFLGSHASYGDMSESFRNGQRCGSKPRQADVTYTLGDTLSLVDAKETSTCVYEFVVQLPESHCALPLTPLDDLDTDNEEHENEREEEEQAETEAKQECKKWCYSKKHKNKAWKQPGKPYKCGWFECAACDECK